MGKKIFFTAIFVLLSICFSHNSFAFPDEEKGSIDLGLQQAKRMFITSDQRYIWMCQDNLINRIDVASYTLTDEQPYDISNDTTTFTGNFTDFIFRPNSNDIYVAEDNGNMLIYPLDDMTAKPTILQISTDGKKLGPVTMKDDETVFYIITDPSTSPGVITYPVGTTPIPSPVSLTTVHSAPFAVKSVLYVKDGGSNGELYISTDLGFVITMPSDGGTTFGKLDIAIAAKDELAEMALLPNSTTVYVINKDATKVYMFDAKTHTVSGTVIDLSAVNNTLTNITIAQVSNPTATYAYVSGGGGLSVIDTADNSVLDLGTTATDHEPIPTTKYGPMLFGSDGYIYMSDGGGSLVVFSANPFLTFNSVVYSNGSTYLGPTDSVTINWQSDTSGTYEEFIGGTIFKTGGTAFVDDTGSSTGAAVAATAISQTFNYTDNSSKLVEGNNDAFFFVTDADGIRGRRAVTIVVNTPPPAVNIESIGFGQNKLYVNMTRLSANDIAYYNLYADEDPDLVITKTDVSGTAAQTTSGTVTGIASGLTNGTFYYIAAEAVDTVGQISPTRTYTYADGSRVVGRPENVVGPAEYSGETGCSLGIGTKHDEQGHNVGIFLLLVALIPCLFLKLSRRKAFLLIFGAVLLMPSLVSAVERSPQWWSTELKAEFWLPRAANTKLFIDQCCNVGGRVQGGLLYKSKFNVIGGVGAMYITGDSRGTISGAQSQDKFSLLLIPMETSFVFRADFKENQFVVPYVNAGADYVFFRESSSGHSVKGLKTGLHAAGGVQFLMEMLDSSGNLERDYGINDIYLTLEGRYNWINSFGGHGLDLSGLLFSLGFLLEF